MMDIINLIPTVGFPIVACVCMGLYIKYIEDRHRDERISIINREAEFQKQMTDTINNNTLALQHLSDLINRELEEDDLK